MKRAKRAAAPVVSRVEATDVPGMICTHAAGAEEACEAPAYWKVYVGDAWAGMAACAEHVPRWRR